MMMMMMLMGRVDDPCSRTMFTGALATLPAYAMRSFTTVPRPTQPCISPGSLNRVPDSAGVNAGMSLLPGGRCHCVIPYMAYEFP